MTTEELLIVDDLVLRLSDDDGASGQDPLQSGSGTVISRARRAQPMLLAARAARGETMSEDVSPAADVLDVRPLPSHRRPRRRGPRHDDQP